MKKENKKEINNKQEEQKEVIPVAEKVSILELGEALIAVSEEEEGQKEAILKDPKETKETKEQLVEALKKVEKMGATIGQIKVAPSSPKTKQKEMENALKYQPTQKGKSKTTTEIKHERIKDEGRVNE